MRPLEMLVQRTVADELTTRLLRRRLGYTAPSEITRAVLADESLQWSLSHLPPGDTFQLRAEVEERVRGLVRHYMHTSRDGYGVRLWETYRVPGQRESRWLPTRGMTLAMALASGQAKMRQGRILDREGRLLVKLAQVGQSMGLGLDDTLRGQYEAIAQEAVRQLADEDAQAKAAA